MPDPLDSFMVRLDGGDPIPLMQLFVENEEMSDDECLEIEAALRLNGAYRGGGGAAAEFVITVAEG